jgi:hypothetical protein
MRGSNGGDLTYAYVLPREAVTKVIPIARITNSEARRGYSVCSVNAVYHGNAEVIAPFIRLMIMSNTRTERKEYMR